MRSIYFGVEAVLENWPWINEREFLNALIPCGKPKTNDNGKYKRKIERERERMEARVLKWFGYVSLCPQDVANGLHLYYILLYYILDDYNIL